VDSRLKKFAALPAGEKWLLLQAWCLLGWYRVALQLVAFRRLTGGLEHQAFTPATREVTPAQREQAITIGRLVASAASVTPWQSRCLVQALVTCRLLAARGIPGQFCLGVRKGCDVSADPTGFAAHAWLQCGDAIITGAAGHEEYAVVSTYRW